MGLQPYWIEFKRLYPGPTKNWQYVNWIQSMHSEYKKGNDFYSCMQTGYYEKFLEFLRVVGNENIN